RYTLFQRDILRVVMQTAKTCFCLQQKRVAKATLVQKLLVNMNVIFYKNKKSHRKIYATYIFIFHKNNFVFCNSILRQWNLLKFLLQKFHLYHPSELNLNFLRLLNLILYELFYIIFRKKLIFFHVILFLNLRLPLNFFQNYF